MLMNVEDIRDFDGMLKRRIGHFRHKLRDWLAPHRLTLAEARIHKVLVPMVGVYTVGWQALPACSWEFVELITNEGPVGTGEWPVDLPDVSRQAIEELRHDPGRDLLDPALEELRAHGAWFPAAHVWSFLVRWICPLGILSIIISSIYAML